MPLPYVNDLQAYVLDAIATLLSDPRRAGEWAERLSGRTHSGSIHMAEGVGLD